MAHHLEYLLVSLLFTAWGCRAQLTGNFTFCPGDSAILTCSLSATAHVWQFSGSTAAFTLLPTVAPIASTADGNIMFAITGVEGGTITSTMTFTASVSVISNGTWVSCSNTTIEPRMIFNETVDIFGTVSPPHMPTLTRASGDYTSLTLSFQQPLYGHECVTGYRVSGPNIMKRSTQTVLMLEIDLCQMVDNFSLFALTANGNGNAITVTSSVPDFSDLGRVSNLSISTDNADKSHLQWTPPPNASEDCISGYTIQWPGNSVNINGSANSVEVSFLITESNNRLPFCVNVLTTVTPSVPVLPTPLLSSQNDPPVTLVYPDPVFPSPSVILRGSGSDGTGLDTVVSWQDLSSSSFGENINVSAGIQQGGQCQGTRINGTSQVFPYECSAAGTVVEFCVVFEHMQCRKMSVSSRQLPSFVTNTSAVTVSETTTNTIKLEIELSDISGGRCSVNGLRIVSTLFRNNVATTPDIRTYRSGLNVITFSGLKSGTSYKYQINVTDGSNVIASYSSQVGTVSPFPVVAVVVPIVVVVVLILVLTIVVIIIKLKKFLSRGSGKDSSNISVKPLGLEAPTD